jgi:hypothetical protein
VSLLGSTEVAQRKNRHGVAFRGELRMRIQLRVTLHEIERDLRFAVLPRSLRTSK